MTVRLLVYRLIMAKFECPHCPQRIDAPEELAGTNAECPACGGAITVPALSHTPPATPPPIPAAPVRQAPPANAGSHNPTCNVCGLGELQNVKKYRLSGPAVVIGYILLVPSILGILIGGLLLILGSFATSETSSGISSEITETLTSAYVPEHIIQKVVNDEELTSNEVERLKMTFKYDVVKDAQLSRDAGMIGVGIGATLMGGVSIVLIVGSFVAGLIGWILIMKKRVLQCSSCKMTVAAS